MISVIIIITAAIMTLMSMSIGEYSPKPNASGKGPMRMKIAKAPPPLASAEDSEARISVTNPIIIRRKPVKRSFPKVFKAPQP